MSILGENLISDGGAQRVERRCQEPLMNIFEVLDFSSDAVEIDDGIGNGYRGPY